MAKTIKFPRAAAILLTILMVVSCALGISAGAQKRESNGAGAEHGVFVVFLGTGTPRPDPNRQGQSLAIVANGKAYIVDAGVGVVRQAGAAYQRGISALKPNGLDLAFLTHLHSDHTMGLPDLILTPWVMHRTVRLRLYGPVGTQAMADNIERAYEEDIKIRIEGLEHQTTTGHQVVVHEVQPGVIYEDANMKVTAFAVLHGSWKEALGYRFDADGKSIVISGDTRPAESVVKACDGCDVLIHEVHSGLPGLSADEQATPDQKYFHSFHTSAEELGEIAAKARPKLLVLVHWVVFKNASYSQMFSEIHKTFHGPVIAANDLDVIAP